MRLKELLLQVKHEVIKGNTECGVSGVVYDSRKVETGSLFVCLKGFQSDGHQYIASAVQAGASAIVVEDAGDYSVYDVTVVKVDDTREALAYISASWFGNPAESMTVIGLTGTKGKTTTAHMIKRVFEETGNTVGMIGTLGAYIGEEKIPTKNTTPESYELHSLFAEMKNRGCKYVVMEVSSQALKQNRTAGILFDYGAFLNLSLDHIGAGEHKDFEEYKECKKLLFKQTKQAVINIDSEYSDEFKRLSETPVLVTHQKTEDSNVFLATDIEKIWKAEVLGIKFRVAGKTDGEVVIPMPGIFNVENALVAIAIASLAGVAMEVIARGLKGVTVKGRTQLIPETSHFATFMIDYAHNELSMESLLRMLKSYEPKRLVCLFGGGGNKPKQRRFDMGKVAGKYADLTILTTDNPRFERVEDINEEIIEGLNVYQGKYDIILDRKEAIEYLIDTAREGDIIVLIGKGHEQYQDIRGKKYRFCEEEIILDYLKAK